VHKKDRDKE
jgi:hypothetical protein